VGCKNLEAMEPSFQKSFNRVDRYDQTIPSDYELIDYTNRATEFDSFVFDESLEGSFLPLIWEDETNDGYGISAYVGDYRYGIDGTQEAITYIASILSATKLNIDKSNQNGIDYVSSISTFYNDDEKIVTNNPNGSSTTTSMWYLLYPGILYSQVAMLYDDIDIIQTQMLTNIESWYQAYEIMKDTSDLYNVTGFNFLTMEPYQNGIWKEPDSSLGMAVLFYYGYQLTQDEKYMVATMDLLDYAQNYFSSPMYEILLYFAPSLAAELNLKYDTTFDVESFLNDIFDGTSIPRGGWGSIVGSWGDYEVNGLMGSISDGGGYAFSMNSFSAVYTISSVAKYDPRYASSIGKWVLNTVSNARYFFSDQTNEDNQSSALGYDDFLESSNSIIPFEGIRKQQNSKTPYFGGDPLTYDWAMTDFSLYSGAHMGMLASTIEKTNVEAILKIDLNQDDPLNNLYDAYLLYNPYGKDKTVSYEINSDASVNLFDAVTKEVIATNVSGEVDIEIKSGDSVVIYEIPSTLDVTHDDILYSVDGQVIASDQVTIKISNYESNETIENEVKFDLSYVNTTDDEIEQIAIYVNDQTFTFNQLDEVIIANYLIGSGSYNFDIYIQTKKGLFDSTSIRLKLA
jgi:hypothetical protein